jgi:hypothetical protein
MAWILRYRTNLRKRAKDCNGKDTPPEKQDDTNALKMISVQEMNEAERERFCDWCRTTLTPTKSGVLHNATHQIPKGIEYP